MEVRPSSSFAWIAHIPHLDHCFRCAQVFLLCSIWCFRKDFLISFSILWWRLISCTLIHNTLLSSVEFIEVQGVLEKDGENITLLAHKRTRSLRLVTELTGSDRIARMTKSYQNRLDRTDKWIFFHNHHRSPYATTSISTTHPRMSWSNQSSLSCYTVSQRFAVPVSEFRNSHRQIARWNRVYLPSDHCRWKHPWIFEQIQLRILFRALGDGLILFCIRVLSSAGPVYVQRVLPQEHSCRHSGPAHG
jgi:hypothetical protein